MNANAGRDDETLKLYEELVAHLEGAPASAALRALELESPKEFERRAALVRSMLAAAGQARLEPIPDRSIERALALLAAERRGGGWRALVAKLVPPVATDALALRNQVAGLRGFQALYTVDDYDVDLALDESCALIGQLMHREGAALPAGRVVLTDAEGRVSEAALDDLGCFIFAELPPAPLQLSIELGPDLIVVQDLDPTR